MRARSVASGLGVPLILVSALAGCTSTEVAPPPREVAALQARAIQQGQGIQRTAMGLAGRFAEAARVAGGKDEAARGRALEELEALHAVLEALDDAEGTAGVVARYVELRGQLRVSDDDRGHLDRDIAAMLDGVEVLHDRAQAFLKAKPGDARTVLLEALASDRAVLKGYRTAVGIVARLAVGAR